MLRKQINNTLDHFFKTIHRICTTRATLSLLKLCRQSTRYQVWFAILYTVYSSSLKSELKKPGLTKADFWRFSPNGLVPKIRIFRFSQKCTRTNIRTFNENHCTSKSRLLKASYCIITVRICIYDISSKVHNRKRSKDVIGD